jgi:hypothetical protein
VLRFKSPKANQNIYNSRGKKYSSQNRYRNRPSLSSEEGDSQNVVAANNTESYSGEKMLNEEAAAHLNEEPTEDKRDINITIIERYGSEGDK